MSHGSPGHTLTAGTLPRKHDKKTAAYSAPCLLGPLLARPPASPVPRFPGPPLPRSPASPVPRLPVRPPLTHSAASRSPLTHSAAPHLHGPPLAPQHTTGGQQHMLAGESQFTRDVAAEKQKSPVSLKKKLYRVGTLAASRVGNPRGRDTRAFGVEVQYS